MAASTTVLPPLTCTARREASQVIGCCFAARPATSWLFVSSGPVPDGESAGCVCLQSLVQQAVLPAVPVLKAVCLSIFACHAHCPHQFLPPFSCFAPIHLVCLPRSCPCAPGSVSVPAVCKLRELSCWQLQHGPAEAARAPVFDSFDFFFSCRVHDPGPWV